MSRDWKDIVGYEDLYEVSNDKVIRNKTTLYELKQFLPKDRKSLYVALTKDGRTLSKRVETIYYKAFGDDDKKDIGLKNEIWIDVVGYENIYQISNYGRVRSIDRYIEQSHSDGYIYKRFIKGKLLSLNRTNGNGYHVVQLSNGYNNKPKGNEYIHILVAKHFIPNPENKPTVNHIDGNKSNNKIDNLEWATQLEQMKHAYRLGLNIPPTPNLKGSELHNAKLNEKQAMEIYTLAHSNNYTQKQIAKRYGVSRRTVGGIKNKKSWKHIHNVQ